MAQLLPNLSFMYDNIDCGVFFQNAEGVLIDVNPAALAMFGLDRDQFLGRTSRHPEWRVIGEDGIPLHSEDHPSMAALRSGKPVTGFIAGVFNPRRQEFVWLRINAIPMFHPEETSPYSVFVSLSDITAERKSVSQLRRSEERYRAIVNTQSAFVNRFLPGGLLTFVNDTLCRYTGVSREELLGKSFFSFFHEDDREHLARILESLTPESPTADTTDRVVLQDGSLHWHDWANTAIFDQSGAIVEYQSVGRDITSQKLAEIALQESEHKFRTLFSTVQDAVFLTVAADGRIIECNDKLSGFTREEIVGRTTAELGFWVDPVTRQRVIDLVTTQGYANDVEAEFRRKDGSIFIGSISTNAVSLQGETYLISIVRDITERKKHFETLDYVNECFTQALNGSSHILYRLNVKAGCYDYLGPVFEKITGYPVAEFRQTSLEQLKEYFHPEDRIAIFTAIEDEIQSRAGNTFNLELEYRLRKADGSYCWLHDCTTFLVGADGGPELFWGSAYDVTERKQMEISLLESEERYRRFIATANEGISITDSNYVITYVNDRFAAMLGYEPQELLGVPVSRLLPPEEQGSFALHMAARRKGENNRRECWHLRKDGSRAWLLTSTAPILDDAGMFQGCFAMFTDLTSRREAEIALKHAYDELEVRVAQRTASLADANDKILKMSYELIRAEEQERGRIAAELHDQVGQSLLLAKMKLDMLASDLRSEKERTFTEAIARLLETSIHDIRTLTFGMRPPMLDTAGLEAALHWLCSSIRVDYQLQVDFRGWDCRSKLPNVEMNYLLYQAIRELLLNVVKHAGVDRAELTIGETAGSVRICIADNGIGFDYAAAIGNQGQDAGFGLFNVKQRIEQLGGSFAVESASGSGTVATVTIPVAEC